MYPPDMLNHYSCTVGVSIVHICLFVCYKNNRWLSFSIFSSFSQNFSWFFSFLLSLDSFVFSLTFVSFVFSLIFVSFVFSLIFVSLLILKQIFFIFACAVFLGFFFLFKETSPAKSKYGCSFLYAFFFFFLVCQEVKHTWVNQKCLLYFGNMRHNSAAPNAFAEVVKGVNHTRQWTGQLD